MRLVILEYPKTLLVSGLTMRTLVSDDLYQTLAMIFGSCGTGSTDITTHFPGKLELHKTRTTLGYAGELTLL